jgi:hypothetical protein
MKDTKTRGFNDVEGAVSGLNQQLSFLKVV